MHKTFKNKHIKNKCNREDIEKVGGIKREEKEAGSTSNAESGVRSEIQQ